MNLFSSQERCRERIRAGLLQTSAPEALDFVVYTLYSGVVFRSLVVYQKFGPSLRGIAM